MKMLPHPSPQEVKEFQALVQMEYGITLTDAEALDWATRAMQIFYIQNYGTHPLCPIQD